MVYNVELVSAIHQYESAIGILCPLWTSFFPSTPNSIPPLKLSQSTRLSSLQVWVLSCFSHVWLCDPTDYSPPGSSIHGILQARILEWVACPPLGDLSHPGIKLESLMFPALSGSFFITSAIWKVLSSLSQTANSQWLSILHLVVCSFHAPLCFPPLPSPPCPQVCSLCLKCRVPGLAGGLLLSYFRDELSYYKNTLPRLQSTMK